MPPTLWVSPTFTSPDTCRSPAMPRICFHISTTCPAPEAPTGCPFDFSPPERLLKLAEGIDIPGLRIKQFGIKIFLSGLLLLRSPVVIYGKKNAVIFLATGSQINGRFAAIAADFQTRPRAAGFKRQIHLAEQMHNRAVSAFPQVALDPRGKGDPGKLLAPGPVSADLIGNHIPIQKEKAPNGLVFK